MFFIIIKALVVSSLLLSIAHAQFTPSVVSLDVQETSPGEYTITYNLFLGDEAAKKDVEAVVLFTRDTNGQVLGTPYDQTISRSAQNTIQYTVSFEPVEFLLMGATTGVLESDNKPSVMVVSSPEFQNAVAGYRFSHSFLQSEQRYAVPKLRAPEVGTNLGDLVDMVSNPGILADPFFTKDLDQKRIIHFTIGQPGCSPTQGGPGCMEGEPCSATSDCIAGLICDGSSGRFQCIATPAPTRSPTLAPTASPTPAPTVSPTPAPTVSPTPAPTSKKSVKKTKSSRSPSPVGKKGGGTMMGGKKGRNNRGFEKMLP